jgi:hypothetical protein
MVQPDVKSDIGKFIETIQGIDSALNESLNALPKAAVGSQDWSAHADILKLAHFVLTERFAEAASLMRKLGRKNRPSKAEYLGWPLFEEFRKTPEFLSALQDFFGDETLAEAEVRTLQKSAVS